MPIDCMISLQAYIYLTFDDTVRTKHLGSATQLTIQFMIYGSLYVTLCFVLCHFNYLLLYVEFSVLCTMMHILNGANHKVEARWRTNEERKTRVYVFLFIRRDVSFYTFEIDAAGNYHSQKVNRRLSV